MKNELQAEMLGMHSLNAMACHNSSARNQMFGSHFSQRLIMNKADEKLIQTGVEQEFGKYTFSIKMPEDGRIIKIIQRYPAGIDNQSLHFNPETIVIYENDKDNEIDYFTIPHYCSYDEVFGFKYEFKDGLSKLRTGAYIPKDTIFADSPGVGDNSNYKYGLNFNTAFMSVPSVSEDGIMISEAALQRLKFPLFESRSIEFGAGYFPLNLYGTKDKYKPFPDIGDYIREDGLLMMTRQYDEDLTPVEMSIYDTMEPDFIFDKALYTRAGKGRVIDIKVFSNNNPTKQLPSSMAEALERYKKALLKYHQEIINTEIQLMMERKRKYGEAKVKLSPKLHRLIVESMAITNHVNNKAKQNLNLIYRKNPLDEYRVEFVIEYEITPNIGFKLSDQHGGMVLPPIYRDIDTKNLFN
jgi:hypothetical protein